MIRVLIVDDSVVARKLLRRVLEQDPDVQVVGEAGDGQAGVRAVLAMAPDVVTMDIRMPGLDGFEATRRIMQTTPVPIVIVSASYRPADVEMTFRALDAGALTVLPKPPGIEHPRHEQMARELVRTVKLMSEIVVVRRAHRAPSAPVNTHPGPGTSPRHIRVIAIGASTGGPPALREILANLPPDLQAPVLVVQHIAPGFTRGFVDWLNLTSKLRVHVATHNEYALPGSCYVAAEGFHLSVENGGCLMLDSSAPIHGLRPSVTALFRSVGRQYGSAAIGVLLTGMGRDGASELRAMKEQGAVTICQDQESCIVHGMPGEAIRLGAATHVRALHDIAPLLNHFAGAKRKNDGSN